MRNITKINNRKENSMKKLKDFCSEFGFNEMEVQRANGDLIILHSGELFINDERFFEELPLRGRPLSRKKLARKKVPHPKTGRTVWQGNNPGLIKSFLNRKLRQIARLKDGLLELQEKVTSATDDKPELEYTMHTWQLELFEAEEEQVKAQERYEELLEKRKVEAQKKAR